MHTHTRTHAKPYLPWWALSQSCPSTLLHSPQYACCKPTPRLHTCGLGLGNRETRGSEETTKITKGTQVSMYNRTEKSIALRYPASANGLCSVSRISEFRLTHVILCCFLHGDLCGLQVQIYPNTANQVIDHMCFGSGMSHCRLGFNVRNRKVTGSNLGT